MAQHEHDGERKEKESGRALLRRVERADWQQRSKCLPDHVTLSSCLLMLSGTVDMTTGARSRPAPIRFQDSKGLMRALRVPVSLSARALLN